MIKLFTGFLPFYTRLNNIFLAEGGPLFRGGLGLAGLCLKTALQSSIICLRLTLVHFLLNLPLCPHFDNSSLCPHFESLQFFISSFLVVYVSDPYSTTVHISRGVVLK